MKYRFLAALSVLLAIGCAEAPSSAPSSAGQNSTGVSISIPDDGGEGTVAADEQLVSLKIEGMT